MDTIDEPIIDAQGLVKRYGATTALDGLDLTVPAGTVFGLLGPNGAGKTTAVRVLTTLIRPDAGTVRIAGYDAIAQPARVREVIGLTGQYAALDAFQTGHANLVMLGRLSGLSKRQAKVRAGELLERFDLIGAGGRAVAGYSGGMRRRLDLAASLLTAPRVLFLDEPTTGLDTRSRLALWEVVRGLVAQGTTVLLTTQYLEEADQLAERIVVIDHGRVVAEGTPSDLKATVGASELVLTIATDSDITPGADIIERTGLASGRVHIDRDLRQLRFLANQRPHLASDLIGALSHAGTQVQSVTTRQPTLDQVFLTLTGQPAAPADSARQADAESLPSSTRTTA